VITVMFVYVLVPPVTGSRKRSDNTAAKQLAGIAGGLVDTVAEGGAKIVGQLG